MKINVFEHLLEGWQVDQWDVEDDVDLENRLEEYMRSFAWCDVPTTVQEPIMHSRYVCSADGISCYYCYGADHYWFEDNDRSNILDQEVQCLECEAVYPHEGNEEACPHCGNADNERTVFLQEE